MSGFTFSSNRQYDNHGSYPYRDLQNNYNADKQVFDYHHKSSYRDSQYEKKFNRKQLHTGGSKIYEYDHGKYKISNNDSYLDHEYCDGVKLIKFNNEAKNDKQNKAQPDCRLMDLWAKGGNVKLLTSSCDKNFVVLCKNVYKFRYQKLFNFFSKFGVCSSICDLGEDNLRIMYNEEESVRRCYHELKKDPRFEVNVLLDVEEYRLRKRDEKSWSKFSKPIYRPSDLKDENVSNADVVDLELYVSKVVALESCIQYNSHKRSVKVEKNNRIPRKVNQDIIKEPDEELQRISVHAPQIEHVNKFLRRPKSYACYKYQTKHPPRGSYDYSELSDNDQSVKSLGDESEQSLYPSSVSCKGHKTSSSSSDNTVVENSSSCHSSVDSQRYSNNARLLKSASQYSVSGNIKQYPNTNSSSSSSMHNYNYECESSVVKTVRTRTLSVQEYDQIADALDREIPYVQKYVRRESISYLQRKRYVRDMKDYPREIFNQGITPYSITDMSSSNSDKFETFETGINNTPLKFDDNDTHINVLSKPIQRECEILFEHEVPQIGRPKSYVDAYDDSDIKYFGRESNDSKQSLCNKFSTSRISEKIRNSNKVDMDEALNIGFLINVSDIFDHNINVLAKENLADFENYINLNAAKSSSGPVLFSVIDSYIAWLTDTVIKHFKQFKTL